MRKTFTLTIAPDYVQNWTAQDAIREFIQNWIDQKNLHPNAGSKLKAKDNFLIIENNESILERKTLLLGGGTKTNDKDSIGGFGEGYKIALLVLTRLDFKVNIINYGLGELWEPSIEYSHDFYSDALKITCKKLDNNKNFEKGVCVVISKDNFDFKKALQEIYLETREPEIMASNYQHGDILNPSTEGGRIYIGGLFIAKSEELKYGYNLKPGVLEIGRDRNIVDTFNIKYYLQYIIKNLKDEYKDMVFKDLEDKIEDLIFVSADNLPDSVKILAMDKYASKQVISKESDKQILEEHGIEVKNPIVVHSAIKSLVWENNNDNNRKKKPIKKKTLKDLLSDFIKKHKLSLTESQIEELKILINRKE